MIAIILCVGITDKINTYVCIQFSLFADVKKLIRKLMIILKKRNKKDRICKDAEMI